MASAVEAKSEVFVSRDGKINLLTEIKDGDDWLSFGLKYLSFV
jgi:hypothetical protein